MRALVVSLTITFAMAELGCSVQVATPDRSRINKHDGTNDDGNTNGSEIGDGNGSGTLANAPQLQNAAAQVYKVGVAIVPFSFANTGGSALSCTVSPQLPDGLLIAVNLNTCRISGTAVAAQSAITYTVTATASDGSQSSATISIAVNPASQDNLEDSTSQETSGVSVHDYGMLGNMPETGLFVLSSDPNVVQSESSGASISLNLTAGRSYNFSLFMNRELLHLTNCSSSSNVVAVDVVDGILILDIQGLSSANTTNISCDGGGSVEIDLNISPSPLWHVSSSSRVSRTPPHKISIGGFSKDGKIVAYTITGFVTSHAQVLVKNLETGKIQIASSSNGEISGIANAESYINFSGLQPAGIQYGNLSEDGRFVVFYSKANNLVTGVPNNTNFHVYRKDLQNPGQPPVLVDSLDSTEADQSDFLAVGSSSNASMSPDGRFIVFESTASNFYTGTGSRLIYIKDLDAPQVKPKIASSLDHTQQDQSQTISVNSVNKTLRVGASGVRNSSVSPDGRFVFFRGNSNMANALDGNGNGYQILRRDMTKTVANEADFLDDSKNPFVLVTSTNSAGVSQSGKATSSTGSAVTSDDGRYVAYVGVDVTSGAPAAQAMFVDFASINAGTYTGVTPKVVSSADPSQTNQSGYYADSGIPQSLLMSRDGRYVMFYSAATNLATGTNGGQIWMWDRDFPNDVPKTLTSLDSTQSDQTGFAGSASSGQYYLANETKNLVFQGNSDRFLTGENEWSVGQEMFTRSLTTLTSAPLRIDPIHNQKFIQRESLGNNVIAAKISGNGRYMIWAEVGAVNFFKGLGTTNTHVFWKDLHNPLNPIKIVSSTAPDELDQTLSAFSGHNGANGIDVSDDGDLVVFTTTSSNAFIGMVGRQIVGCRMLTAGYPCSVINSTDRGAADQSGKISVGSTVESPKISGNGMFVAWLESNASYGYSNVSTRQVFGKSLTTEALAVGPHILSSTEPTTSNQSTKLASAAVSSFAINSTGNKIAFTSAATNLCNNCTVSSRVQVYLGDYTVLATPSFKIVSSRNPSAADQATDRGNANSAAGLAWSGNDRYIVFLSQSTNLNGHYETLAGSINHVWRVDLNNLDQAPALVSSSDPSATDQTGKATSAHAQSGIGISNDGDRVYFSTTTQGYIAATAGIAKRRVWERRMSAATLHLQSFKGGDSNVISNIFSTTDCDVTGASKQATPIISILCTQGSDMQGISTKTNVYQIRTEEIQQ